VNVDLVLLSGVSYQGREIAGQRMRGLLAMLAGDLRTGCGTARLVDGLWPEEQPGNPTKALQVLVSRTRAQLGPQVIESTPTGYRLALGEDQLDTSVVLVRAAASARQLRAGDHAAALAHAEAGLALWDDPPESGSAADDPVEALRAERAPAYRSLFRVRALALAGLGRLAEAVEPLARLAAELPHDEEILLELLRCETVTAGSAAALARYDRYRRSLRDELGTDPGAAVQAAYRRLLQGDAPAVRHGVGFEPNPLLGRAEDLAAVAALVRRSRVTSIIGPGGLGKTRLATAAGRDAEQRLVWFVPLAGVTGDDDVLRQVASVVGAVEHADPAQPMIAAVAAALGPGPALLVLDNCEQVIRGVAEMVRALVSLTPELHVLTTSRTALGLSSESVYALPELDLTTMVELFGQRARAARPGVELPAETVAALCRQLDGLPLAVELAAARVRVMSVAEVAGALADRFGLLRGGLRDAPERHRTMRAVVDWSWNLLDPAGQAAMHALSIFPDGFTAGAARRMLGDELDAWDILAHLADQSLLKVADTGTGARFRMLESVREFSAARRPADGTGDGVATGFLAWARDFGTTYGDAALGLDPAASLDLIRAEQENLLQALHQAAARSDGATVAATTAVLAGIWVVESDYARFAALIATAGPVLSHYRPAPEHVEVTRTAATLCTAFTYTIEPRATRFLLILRRLPAAPPTTLSRASAIVLGSLPELLADGGAGLRELCDSREPLLAGVANAVATYVWESEGRPGHALSAAERTLAAFGDRAAPWARLLAHARLGELHQQDGRGAQAMPQFVAALRVLEGIGIRHETLGIRISMVSAALQLGDVDAAERQLALVEPEFPEYALDARSYSLAARAELLLARGQIEAGLRMWRRVAALLRDAVDRDDLPGMTGWTLEVESATVVAHVRHGRIDLVAALAAAVHDRLSELLSILVARRAYLGYASCGAALLALATVDLDRGDARSGVRLTALAVLFRFRSGFQPTMSHETATQAAGKAAGAAYAEDLSAYAALARDQLPAAALAALRERAHP
jgi:predicted ATPase/DNA-binding SARP family transcriptional activator